MIEDRLYTVTEVSKLLCHSTDYVRALIDTCKLDGIRLAGPGDSRSQWRIRPESLRRYLGIGQTRSTRTMERQAAAEYERFEAKRRRKVT